MALSANLTSKREDEKLARRLHNAGTKLEIGVGLSRPMPDEGVSATIKHYLKGSETFEHEYTEISITQIKELITNCLEKPLFAKKISNELKLLQGNLTISAGEGNTIIAEMTPTDDFAGENN